MINAKKIEEIAQQVSDAIPAGLKNVASDIEEKTKTVLQRKLSELDVVTREEFDVQTQVLIKTRAKYKRIIRSSCQDVLIVNVDKVRVRDFTFELFFEKWELMD